MSGLCAIEIADNGTEDIHDANSNSFHMRFITRYILFSFFLCASVINIAFILQPSPTVDHVRILTTPARIPDFV